jgi:hypothetical protein
MLGLALATSLGFPLLYCHDGRTEFRNDSDTPFVQIATPDLLELLGESSFDSPFAAKNAAHLDANGSFQWEFRIEVVCPKIKSVAFCRSLDDVASVGAVKHRDGEGICTVFRSNVTIAVRRCGTRGCRCPMQRWGVFYIARDGQWRGRRVSVCFEAERRGLATHARKERRQIVECAIERRQRNSR